MTPTGENQAHNGNHCLSTSPGEVLEELQQHRRISDAESARAIAPRYFALLSIYTWAWFLMPMTTLGLSTLLNAQRQVFNFHGLYTIGVIIYIFRLAEKIFLFAARFLLFCLYKDSFRRSLEDPSKAMFFATF